MRNGNVTKTIAKWATGEMDLHYSGCNVSIRNGVLYSYNMPLAKFGGRKAYLVPYETCPSQTTRKHYGEMQRHVWGSDIVYVETL